jgi:hypothetical protein
MNEGNYEFGLRSAFVHTSKELLTCRKILRHAVDDFTSSPKEGVLRICVALKNPLASTGIEPPNLGSNGKHAIHCTTEDEVVLCYYFVCSGLHLSPVERFFLNSLKDLKPADQEKLGLWNRAK